MSVSGSELEYLLWRVEYLLRQIHKNQQDQKERENQMAIRVSIAPEDVARQRVVTQGATWYPVVVRNIVIELNKAGDANNFVTDFEVDDGPDKGCRARVWFSEKAIGMMIPFLKAVGVDVPNSGLADFDIEPAIGRQVLAFIQVEDYNGKPGNVVKDYRKR